MQCRSRGGWYCGQWYGGNGLGKTVTQVHSKEFWAPKSFIKLIYQFMVQKGRGFKGLSSPTKAIEFCLRNLSAETFDQCNYLFYVVALNLGSGEKEVLSTGQLAPSIMASAAMPVLYEPVEVNGEYYTDGAIIDLAPADAICCRHKLDLLIIHHVAQRDYNSEGLRKALARPWSFVEILHRLIYRTNPGMPPANPVQNINAPVVVVLIFW